MIGRPGQFDPLGVFAADAVMVAVMAFAAIAGDDRVATRDCLDRARATFHALNIRQRPACWVANGTPLLVLAYFMPVTQLYGS